MATKKSIKENSKIDKPGFCNKRDGKKINCFDRSFCNKCGWNPEVAKKRIEAWKARR